MGSYFKIFFISVNLKKMFIINWKLRNVDHGSCNVYIVKSTYFNILVINILVVHNF